MTGMLASVKDLNEARIALTGGVDIIDLKDPARGALGALSLTAIAAIVKDIGGRAPVSATIGDLPMEPRSLTDAARSTAAAGVDYVKIGLFGDADAEACVQAISQAVPRSARLVAVLFADLAPAWQTLLPTLRRSGFHGVMLDTAGKQAGGLRKCMDESELDAFIMAAKRQGLFTGLAGSLHLEDVPPLLQLQPDYLGFRTALCAQRQRCAALDPQALDRVRACIPQGPTLRLAQA